MSAFRRCLVVKDTAALLKLENKEGIPRESAYLGPFSASTSQRRSEFANSELPGDTVFVEATSGTVGAIVVQLSKANGCRVIVSTGAHEKFAYVASLGPDAVFNYKLVPTTKVLEREGPINIYWDNVRGEVLEAALKQAATHARVIVRPLPVAALFRVAFSHRRWRRRFQFNWICGSASTYGTAGPYDVKNLQVPPWKEIRMNGFLVAALEPKYQEEFYREVPAKHAKGEVKYKEDFVRGLEKSPEAIVEVHKGDDFGKSVLVVGEE
ncbi:uncharacterized protein BXZ73DRAFT_100935 [Epithele typhae]|uniref:uncharacterized protein n=1 Tax=Epithele typhae TaxID=378194 RepID=UPI00200895AD|nr:uncharacterized protein BXZ73DRAFT_100935 [Epithele typhae]KAH9933550.1 hypothetical protein BXZ73DRAFT_100935 [Epithele typhae]